MKLRRLFCGVSIAACILLTGCGATSYGPKKWWNSGGYTDKKINDNTDVVSFYGNDSTSSDRVWTYWINRCAEFTKQQGFTAFLLTHELQDAPVPDNRDAAIKRYGWDFIQSEFFPGRPERRQKFNAKKNRWEDDRDGMSTPYWLSTARGVVTMYRPPYPSDGAFLLDADRILEKLKPFMDVQNVLRINPPEPPRREILMDALIVPGAPF